MIGKVAGVAGTLLNVLFHVVRSGSLYSSCCRILLNLNKNVSDSSELWSGLRKRCEQTVEGSTNVLHLAANGPSNLVRAIITHSDFLHLAL